MSEVSLAAFVIRRVLWTIPVLLVVILFTFLLVRAIATGPYAPQNQPLADRAKFHSTIPGTSSTPTTSRASSLSISARRAFTGAERSTTSSRSNTRTRCC
jgi:ABC-type microcin C transport system permease subunit YejB